jgi:acyl-CoA reductase-like NAD-dependent aldehyde dehydrogenase
MDVQIDTTLRPPNVLSHPLSLISIPMNFEFLINGKLCHATERTYPIYRKADQSVITEVPDACEADIDAAVAVARDALPVWAATPPVERAAMLLRLSDLMDQHADEITVWN